MRSTIRWSLFTGGPMELANPSKLETLSLEILSTFNRGTESRLTASLLRRWTSRLTKVCITHRIHSRRNFPRVVRLFMAKIRTTMNRILILSFWVTPRSWQGKVRQLFAALVKARFWQETESQTILSLKSNSLSWRTSLKRLRNR